MIALLAQMINIYLLIKFANVFQELTLIPLVSITAFNVSLNVPLAQVHPILIALPVPVRHQGYNTRLISFNIHTNIMNLKTSIFKLS